MSTRINLDLSEVLVHRYVVSRRTTWYFVEVRSSQGGAGVGEFSGPVDLPLARSVIEVAAARLARCNKREPVDVVAQNLWNSVSRHQVDTDRLTVQSALGAVITALCDLAATAAGLPLWQWLERPRHHRDAVSLYANINRFDGPRSPDRFVELAQRAMLAGFDAVKLAPFDGEPLPGSTRERSGLDRLRAVRECIGEDVGLMVDMHRKLERTELLACLPDLEQLGVIWLEDAVDVEDDEEVAWLAGGTTIPLSGGERVLEPDALEALLARTSLAHTLVDPKWVGGPFRVLASLQFVGRAKVSFHNPHGPVGTALCLQLAQLVPNFSFLEHAVGEGAARKHVIDGGEVVAEGMASLPGGPGLGVALNVDAAGLETIDRHERLWAG